jgi:hypothetical protein
MVKLLFTVQGVLQFFVALGALVAGVMFLIEPSGRLLQAPPDMLKGSPFSNFIVPGIILLAVNGIGQAYAAYLTLTRHRHAGILGGVFGLGLVIWIFVQVTLIGGGAWIQNLYFCFGIVQTTFAFFIDRALQNR